MKKQSLVIVFLVLPLWSMACDICGCGIGNNYIGILPDFQKRIVGLRYRYNSMLTHLGADGEHTYLTTWEQYQNMELWAGWNIKDNLRIVATLPYNMVRKESQGIGYHKSGPGDILLQAYYELLQRRSSWKEKLLVQSLWIGGGVKLPVGKYQEGDQAGNTGSNNLFQLGTGSTDFIIAAMYDARIQDAGINLNANYRLNTINRYDYRYGNKWSLSAQLYYKFRLSETIGIAPNAGIQYENAVKDRDEGFYVYTSGGNLLLGSAGVEQVTGRYTIGCSFQYPLSQDIAEGAIKAGNRWMVHAAIAF